MTQRGTDRHTDGEEGKSAKAILHHDQSRNALGGGREMEREREGERERERERERRGGGVRDIPRQLKLGEDAWRQGFLPDGLMERWKLNCKHSASAGWLIRKRNRFW